MYFRVSYLQRYSNTKQFGDKRRQNYTVSISIWKLDAYLIVSRINMMIWGSSVNRKKGRNKDRNRKQIRTNLGSKEDERRNKGLRNDSRIQKTKKIDRKREDK